MKIISFFLSIMLSLSTTAAMATTCNFTDITLTAGHNAQAFTVTLNDPQDGTLPHRVRYYICSDAHAQLLSCDSGAAQGIYSMLLTAEATGRDIAVYFTTDPFSTTPDTEIICTALENWKYYRAAGINLID